MIEHPPESNTKRLLHLPKDTATIAFISSLNELQAVIRSMQPLPAIIAVTPEADYACEKLGIRYFCIDKKIISVDN